jgi:hypothetical protein
MDGPTPPPRKSRLEGWHILLVISILVPLAGIVAVIIASRQ